MAVTGYLLAWVVVFLGFFRPVPIGMSVLAVSIVSIGTVLAFGQAAQRPATQCRCGVPGTASIPHPASRLLSHRKDDASQ
jgi:hypothetical protein